MKFYEFVGGELNGRLCDEDTANTLHYIYGNGLSEDLSEIRNRGGLVHRKELDNEFQFAGYLGPMWDGTRYLVNGELKSSWACSEAEKANSPECYVLRYETPEVYERLSR